MSTPGERLTQARKDAGFETAAEAARAKEFHPQNLRDHEAGRRLFNYMQADRYGEAFNVDPAWLMFGEKRSPTGSLLSLNSGGDMYPIRGVEVLGRVQAGAYAEIPDEPEVERIIPVSLPGYENVKLFGLHIIGRSMDVYYPDDSIVVVAPAAEVGVREGDHVVVRRRRGGFAETTIKELVIEDGVPVLYPRSTDPAHQEPIRVDRARDVEDSPEIIAVVVAAFTERRPKSGRLLEI